MSKGNSNMHGKIWFYTYPSEKMENLTLDDCTFYGKTNGAIQVTDFNTINQGDNYIFYSKEEQPKAQAGEYTEYPWEDSTRGSTSASYIEAQTVHSSPLRH